MDPGVEIGENVTIVKTTDVKVSAACIHVEPVPFNKGYFSVDITYTFSLTMNTYETPCGEPTEITGTAVFTKKVILFGSEGSTTTFCSDSETNVGTPDLPRVCVQVVTPIVLDTRLVVNYCCDPTSMVSQQDCCCCRENRTRVICGITVSLGLFSIIQLSRTVSVVIPVYDYCVPRKECPTATTESPCEMFDRIKFPTDVFFPPALADEEPGGGCEPSCTC